MAHPIVDELLRVFPRLELAYLLGSYETPYEKPTSDIDLAIWLENPLDEVVRFKFQEQLSLVFKRDVDLIDLYTASTVMRFEVVSKGRLLFKKDEDTRIRFEGLAISMYLRFEIERADIIKDFIARGKS